MTFRPAVLMHSIDDLITCTAPGLQPCSLAFLLQYPFGELLEV